MGWPIAGMSASPGTVAAGPRSALITPATKRFETEVSHEHEAFRNFTGYGIRVGYGRKPPRRRSLPQLPV